MDLSPTKRALLEKWLKGQAGSDDPRIPKRALHRAAQLSFPQKRQLFLELLERGTAVNNLSVLLELNGHTDISALEESANHIIARHEVLRTRFQFGMGLPTPEILDVMKLSLPVVDLTSIDADRRAAARRLAEIEVLQPFDLTRAPLIRLKLFTVSADTNILLVVIHHSIADGWSLGVFLKELMAFYNNITSGEPLPLPELPIQYSDFAEWQTSDSRVMTLTPSVKYWLNQLSGELPVLELPTDKPRGARQSFSGGTYRFKIDSNLVNACEDFSRKQDVTLYMTMLSVFNVLLKKYTGQEDIIVGTPIANRNMPELEPLIGVFINTLAMRNDVSGDPSFIQVLKNVRRVALDAYAHQDLPFEKLVEELKPRRDLSRTPVFQVVFNLQNSPMPPLSVGGIEIRQLELDRGVSEFDLLFMMSKIDGQYEVTVEYNKDLFFSSTIERFCRSFLLLLEQSIARPEAPLSSLAWIPAEEIRRLISDLNQTEVDHPAYQCFHQVFEEQVKKDPGATAVIYGEEIVSYNALNRRTNVLAARLRKSGVVTGTRVGILMERSLSILVALLAVHKAGGTYVPIHHAFPEERVRYILEDADIKVLLTNTEQLPVASTQVFIINVNTDDSFIEDDSDQPLCVSSSDLAYVIYTSGSTGQPKGVMIEHGSLVNFLNSMQREPGIKKEDILLAVTSISFDIAALELFMPLFAGASVVIAGSDMIADPVLMADAIQHYGITIMQATPATWQVLIECGWQGRPGLKALCGGEILTRKLADQLLSRIGSLWNMYGPTETTIWSSVSAVHEGDNLISIGHPIDNTRLYVLDQYLYPVAVGVTGELHIGGRGLARGYLNHDGLTSEKFIPDPFILNPGSRIYKTGDRARYLPDGSIEILGRFDYQVKIHGHRIELGEIEAVLRQHPSLVEAVVVLNGEANLTKRLIAYYVLSPEQHADDTELQDFVRKKLPVYMIPGAWVCLDRLPLTPNGKLDRKALPAPEMISKHEYVGPRNEEERMLVDIWEGVLGLKPVSVLDNFFDLGGASIQSLQIVGHANMAGLRLTAEMIFEYQTIAELAEYLRTGKKY